jgi:hypothetical protein
MLFEVRMYHAAQGRMGDIVDRMRDELPAMLRKHNFPWPVGQWVCVAGARMPLYVWMLHWDDLDHRARCFGALYGDPEWDKIRIRTNGSRDTVVEQRIVFMRKLPCFGMLAGLRQGQVDQAPGLYELRYQRVQYGYLPQADRVLSEVDFPALTRCGARVQGAFEVMSGAPYPTAAYFLRWESFEAREAGLAEFEALPEVKAARAREVAAINNHFLQEFDCYLLRPTGFGIPQPQFGAA